VAAILPVSENQEAAGARFKKGVDAKKMAWFVGQTKNFKQTQLTRKKFPSQEVGLSASKMDAE